MLKVYKILLISIIFHMSASHEFEHLLETNPDKIFENIVGVDFYKVRENLQKTDEPETTQTTEIEETTINYVNESNVDDERPRNMTAQERKLLQIKLRLDSILNEQSSEYKKFHPERDDVEETTRRFNAIQEKEKATRRMLNETNELPLNSRRMFTWYTSWEFLHRQKPRVYALMETFIYVIRNRLPYTQAIRKKYLDTFRYKIGYIFANLKTILEQMQWLYSMMARTWDNFAVFITFHYFLQMYEAMIKYNIDVVDLIDYLNRLEYDRKMIYDPDYYDERPWEPGYTTP